MKILYTQKCVNEKRNKSVSIRNKMCTVQYSKANLTLLLMAMLHLAFYVPLACLRVVALLANAMGASAETTLALAGGSYLCYLFSAPAHLANFVVRCLRVPSFARALGHIVLTIACPWTRMCSDREAGANLSRSSGLII